MNAKRFSGVFPAIVTPFNSDATQVDYKSLARLLDFQIEAGVHGIVVCGSTGEAMTLSDAEYSEVLKFTVKHINKRIPVIAGVGSNNTARAVEIALVAQALGSDAVLVVVPFYNKPSQQGIFEHYKVVASKIKIPIIAYNIPGRAVANMLPETVAKLVSAGIISGLKESSGSLDQLLDTLALVREEISVLIGECSMVHAALASGAHGTISASANIIPKSFVDIFEKYQRGDFTASREAQFEALPTCRAVFAETNPVPVKAALHLAGIIDHPTVRLPLLAAQPTTVERFKKLLRV